MGDIDTARRSGCLARILLWFSRRFLFVTSLQAGERVRIEYGITLMAIVIAALAFVVSMLSLVISIIRQGC